ncbi:cyanophycin synthetase [Catenibacterium sp.]|uniref:glutamate ligase domain-containing protein n=1 Tax=Catenibacterium sp. TaxID=2049022 RepID=UPI00258C0FA6|nr:cyanophycin synthetase [Catenibacterium sp.]
MKNWRQLSNSRDHAKILTYGIHHKADIMAREIEYYIDHSAFNIYIKNHYYHVEVPIIAPFNISNTLAILTTLYALEMTPDEIVNAIKYIQPVEGRMEVVPVKQPFHIIVDYCQHAHNFEEVFKFVHSVKGNGHLIAVFGAPGRKDIHKRSKIGALANKYCDYVILTEQDERDDDIEGICSQIQEQIVKPISVIITDRRYAIQQAIDAACPGDVILILGKGHEQFMTSLVGNTPYPGDKFIAQEYAKKLYNEQLEDDM